MSRQPTANQGKRLGRYRIERELGRGGMGVVYLAEDENTKRLVALKTTAVAGLGGGNASRNQRRARFVREVTALTNINHANVVHVFDAGEADDADLGWLLFYSMDFVDGLTLAQLVQQRGALEPRAAAAVVMQVAAGLGAAHRAGIVHRDVKPANIFISLDGRALVGDFGICKIEGSTQITRRDQLVGTPNYLAPEQILGDEVGPATDVFALGALYYVITMNRPLRTTVDAAALLKSAQGNEPKERMLAEKGVPEPLRKVIARCLERDPKKRWPDGGHLADALAPLASSVPSLRDDTQSDPLKSPTSTAERSSPFAQLATTSSNALPSAASSEVHEAPTENASNAVDEAARALLSGLEGRFGGDKKDKKPDALPVARTESTVMFNLRAMEEEQQEADDDAHKLVVPVARTESTAMFKMREGGINEMFRGGERRLDETFMPDDGAPAAEASAEARFLAERTPVSGMDETRDNTGRPPPVRTFHPPPASRPARPSALADVPRPVLLAATGVGGMLLGLLAAVLLAPNTPELKPVTAGSEQLLLLRRPTICPDVGVVSDADKRKAAQLVREANEIRKEKGGTPTDALEKLRRAAEINPLDKDAFYAWATMLVEQPDRQRDAYACVCLISSASAECTSAKKALGYKTITLQGR